MSRKQWIVIGLLAMGNCVVMLAAVVIVVLPTLQGVGAPAQEAIDTGGDSTPLVTPTATEWPTWTPRLTATPQPSPTRSVSTVRPSATPTGTVFPTFDVTSTPEPTPDGPVSLTLQNPTFDDLRQNEIPGWQTDAFVNWQPGQPADAERSFAEPIYGPALTPNQRISGSTLQIDTEPWVKLRAFVFQVVTGTLSSGDVVQFQVESRGLVADTVGSYLLRVGIDPQGNPGCDGVEWGELQYVNQDDGVVVLSSPEVTVGAEDQVTVCISAETQYADVNHAAFFDNAELLLVPQP